MHRRLAILALSIGLVFGWVLGGCYDVPKPACGFVCGANLACPEDYRCLSGRCVLESVVGTAQCDSPDAGVPGDAPLPPDMSFGPAVIGRMPNDFEDSVPIGTTVTARFSEPVTNVIAGSSFVVFDERFGAVQGTVSMPDPVTAVFTPSAPLRKGIIHTVNLSSPIQDLDGFQLPFTQWQFRTEPDFEPPAVVAQTPMPGATGVALDTPLTVQFSEEVFNVDPSSFSFLKDGISVPGFVGFDFMTKTAIYSYSGLLEPNTTYTVQLGAQIQDPSGNPLAGAPIVWTFTTGTDMTPPELTGRFPVMGDSNVSPFANMNVFFSEEVTNVTNATFTLRQGTTVIPATVTYFAGQAQAILDPMPQLASGTVYTITLEPGITDLAGNPLAGAPTSWSFTTQVDQVGPSVIGRSPLPGTSNVSINSVVTATFNEEVTGISSTSFRLDPGGTGAAVSYSPGARTATLVPAMQLTPATTYTVTLDAGITDLAGNALSPVPQSWTFTTVSDVTPPTATMTTPMPSATNVATSTAIVLLFDEAVNNVGPATFRVTAGGGIGGTYTSAMAGREYTFTPSAPLPAGATVTITLTSGITDVFGNPLAPVSFTFSTAP